MFFFCAFLVISLMCLLLIQPEDIDINIEGPAKVDLKRKDNPDGSTNVTYLPMTPGAYNIHIKYKGKAIKGSPFAAKVSGRAVVLIADIINHFPHSFIYLYIGLCKSASPLDIC